MEIKTRKATMADIDDLVEIEASAIPGYGYVYDDRYFFLEERGNRGEMTLSLADGQPVGMGQYSIMPDGSGWLECLRVRKEYQHMGVGKSIYKRYMELADETNAQSVAMFTGWKNIASRSLAEKYGFTLAASYVEYNLEIAASEEIDDSFREVSSLEEAKRLLHGIEMVWGRFMVLNRTFLHYGEDLYRYLIDRHMLYTDGITTVVVGCRMLEERGWYIGCYTGDAEKALLFAKALTAKKGLKNLTCSFPPDQKEMRELFEAHGFLENGERIVMEWKRSKETEEHTC